MPTYTITSGDLHKTIKTRYEADAMYLFFVAMDTGDVYPETLGLLAEIRGGQYKGDAVMYLDTAAMLCKMGLKDRGV